MTDLANRVSVIEIGLSRQDPSGENAQIHGGSYTASARVQLPNRDVERVEIAKAQLSLDDLIGCQDDLSYCHKLTEQFFSDRILDKAFARVREIADFGNSQLRVRIAIDESAKELQTIAWELLGDPNTGIECSPIASNERRLFSRYLSPNSVRSSQQPIDAKLRTIVLIANPRKKNGRDLDLPSLDTAGQIDLARASLASDSTLRLLVGKDASKEELFAELKHGADILYVACHGALVSDEPILYLEKENQEADILKAKDLVELISGVEALPPRLVVLASCRSAAGGPLSARSDDGFLCSLGALLTRSGVPAVVGMQGDVEQGTTQVFVAKFFEDLMAQGQVERAMSTARQAVRNRTDWWMPVLLLSKDDGQLWPPRIARETFPDWDTLLDEIQNGACTPILGSEVVKPFSNREFTKVLASEVKEIGDANATDELSWIAQQFQTIRGVSVAQRFRTFIRSRLREDGIVQNPNEKLTEAVNRWGKKTASALHVRVLEALASLPLRIFVTTNPDALLEQALSTNGKHPTSQVCPWKGGMKEVQELDVEIDATVDQPCVYHLFGSLDDGSSVVLTEDDFFDHLLWIANHNNLIPIKTPLCNSSLLFLGFQLKDWEFRILLRCIATLPGRDLLGDHTHVAVQIPLETDVEQQTKARDLLKTFFRNANVKLSIYWGSAESFADELQRRLQTRLEEIRLKQQTGDSQEVAV